MRRKTLLASALALLISPAAHATNLMDIYRDAVTQDTQLAIAKAQLEQVRSQADQASGNLLPQISASGTYSHNDVDTDSHDMDYNNLNLNLQAQQILFDGSVWNNRQAADDRLKAAVSQYRDTEQNLLLRTSEAYFTVLRAEDSLTTAQAEEAAIKRQLDQVKEQHEVGLVAITGVYEAQAAYDSARASRIAAEGQLVVSYEALEQLTDKNYEDLEALQRDFPIQHPAPQDRTVWERMALSNNLSLYTARDNVNVAQSSLKAKKAGHYPTLSLVAQHDRNSDTPNGTNTVEQNTTTVGVKASLEIYSGGTTSAAIREGSFALEEAQVSLEQARRSVLQNVRRTYTQVNTDIQTVEAQRLAIKSSQSALDATRAGYEVGTRNVVDVLNAERNLYAAQRDYDDARYDFIIDQLNLKRAAGSLTEQDIQALNQWLSDSPAPQEALSSER